MHDRGLTEGHFIECFSLFLLTFPALLPLPHTVHCQAGMLPPWPRQQAARGGICLASESFAATAEPEAVASKGPETLNFRAPLVSAFSQPWRRTALLFHAQERSGLQPGLEAVRGQGSMPGVQDGARGTYLTTALSRKVWGCWGACG